jgi:asparagine synthase (glutamine-hydrolysing)
MGAFLLADTGKMAGESLARARASLTEQGFAPPAEFAAGSWRAWVYPKLGGTAAAIYRQAAGGFAFATGTFFYRDRFGAAGLGLAHADWLAGRFESQALNGSFALCMGSGGRLALMIDRVGVYKVFRANDDAVFSSSFLAAAASSPSLTADVQGVYEYVFNGATTGECTPLREVRLLGRQAMLEMDGAIRPRPLADPPVEACDPRPFGQQVDAMLGLLRPWFGVVADAFGDNQDTALSGGYDSRLVLALLRNLGRRPRLHVYGRADDADVRIAQGVAAGEGIALEHQDKSRRPLPEARDFAAVVERNFQAFDGTPTDGIFDSGADLESRLTRARNGALMLNGGGGEIFRNFFYLPDRPYSVRELLWTFYSQFDPRSATGAFRESEHYALLERAVRQSIGGVADPLPRCQVERVYPYFRCGFWMGRNNSLNNRLGYALTPFIEPGLVTAAAKVPLRYKNHGRFEAALIAAADPALARYASAYGHDFVGPPSLKRRLKDWATYFRPPWLRRLSFRYKTRAARRPVLLATPYLEQAIDPGLPRLRHFFLPERLHGNEQFARVCTLEYLFQRLGVAAG